MTELELPGSIHRAENVVSVVEVMKIFVPNLKLREETPMAAMLNT